MRKFSIFDQKMQKFRKFGHSGVKMGLFVLTSQSGGGEVRPPKTYNCATWTYHEDWISPNAYRAIPKSASIRSTEFVENRRKFRKNSTNVDNFSSRQYNIEQRWANKIRMVEKFGKNYQTPLKTQKIRNIRGKNNVILRKIFQKDQI